MSVPTLPDRSVGLGCMRLSTGDRPDAAQAIATIHAALDAGVRLLDTADAYARDHTEIGHNERRIRAALEAWDGPVDEVIVATKGGLTRPKGAWVPDGRGKHLTAAIEASCEALGVDAIALYQLHTPDPRTKLATSVRAIAKAHKAGRVRAVGLCNVRLHEIEEAEQHVPVAAIQVAVSPFEERSLRNGVATYALDRGMVLMAHSPFGQPRARAKLRGHPLLVQLAERHQTSVYQVALAWLWGLSPRFVPLVGATRPESIRDSAAAAGLQLSEEERSLLDAAFPAGRVLRVPVADRRPPDDADGEVAILMGCPAAGKSSTSAAYSARGYARLNRDDEGGSLADLVPKLDALLERGQRRVVLDNTYPDRASRNAVVETAWAHGVPVRCDWLTTSEEEASVNASVRMVARHGRMLGPDGIRDAARDYPNSIGPGALLSYRRNFEAPRLDEGFAVLTPIAFARRPSPHAGRAVFVHSEAIWSSAAGKKRPVGAADVVVATDRLARLAEEGTVVVLHRDGDRTEAEVEAMFAVLRAALPGVMTAWCGHPSGPPVCWCRKPYPGLGVWVCEAHQLDPARCTCVGTGRADEGFAATLGMTYVDADTYFAA